MQRLLPVVFCLVIVSAAPADATASFDARLTNPALPTGASMGWRSDAMASDRDRIVLGAYAAQRALVFERTPDGTWAMNAELSPPVDSPLFGIGVAILGDEIVVGASNAASGGVSQAGRAFVYRRSNIGQWQLVQSIDPPVAATTGWFGGSVALDGDLLAIGTGGSAPAAQSVSVYQRGPSGAWILESTLYSPDLGAADAGVVPQFGFPVRLLGGYLATTDCNRDVSGTVDAGRAYVYRRLSPGTWILEARLDHPSPAASDGLISTGGAGYIATNLSLGDSIVAVSFGGDDVAANADQGSVQVFVRSPAGAWMHESGLVASEGRSGDWMGWSTVRIIGDEVLVGSVGWDGPDGNSAQLGRVVRFARSGGGWQQLPAIVDPAGMPGDRFGSGIAHGAGFICISASGWNSSRGCGAVFGFGPDCNGNGTADPLDVVRGAPDLNGNRIPDGCECGSVPWLPVCCIGNLNGDAAVDGTDLSILLSSWGACSSSCPADIDRDGLVHGADLGLLLTAWGPCQ